MPRKDAGTSRAGKPVHPHVTLSHDRSYRSDEFEPLRNKERQYRLKATGQVISRRQYQRATHNFLTPEFMAEKNRAAAHGLDYDAMLRAYAETHAREYGGTGADAIARAEQSKSWQKDWRTVLAGYKPGELGARDKQGHSRNQTWLRKKEAMRDIYGERLDSTGGAVWRNVVSPPQPGRRAEAA